jgi:hypothetical protein
MQRLAMQGYEASTAGLAIVIGQIDFRASASVFISNLPPPQVVHTFQQAEYCVVVTRAQILFDGRPKLFFCVETGSGVPAPAAGYRAVDMIRRTLASYGVIFKANSLIMLVFIDMKVNSAEG